MQRNQKSKPIAVLISDVHYSLATLELADAAFRQAIDKAAELKVDLIDCGDLTNDKALMRGEVMNRMIKTMQIAKAKKVRVICLVGNHSLINEKSNQHTLNFLKPFCTIFDDYYADGDMCFIPYQSTPELFVGAVQVMPKDKILITHQGVIGGNPGHYIHDHSAIPASVFQGRRSIGGHYHNHHTVGNHTFVGNPYTLTFAEASDHPKGFCVLYDDGSLEHVPTNLRKHVVVERTLENRADPIPDYNPGDLLWFKLSGDRLGLDRITRESLAKELSISDSFKFDKIPTDSKVVHMDQKEGQSESEMLDKLIDASPGLTPEDNAALKALYREIM